MPATRGADDRVRRRKFVSRTGIADFAVPPARALTGPTALATGTAGTGVALAEPHGGPPSLLTGRGGRRVLTPEDWWTWRRAEVEREVLERVHGLVRPYRLWPSITWSTGPAVHGNANGAAYVERRITGTAGPSGLHGAPVIRGLLRTPAATSGQPVPVVAVIGGDNSEWEFTAPYNYGVCGFNLMALPPDAGGVALCAWGVSRLIDYFETDPDVDATRIGVQGHPRFGRAALVSAALDSRVGTVLASSVLTSTVLTSTAAETGAAEIGIVSLVAPRPVMLACGTGAPPELGDAWTGAHGQCLSMVVSSPVHELLGWGGADLPPGTYPQLAARYFSASRPVVTPGQHFTIGEDPDGVIGTIRATDAGLSSLGNWQVTGGTGAGLFSVAPDTGQVRLGGIRYSRRNLTFGGGDFTLSVVTDNRKLTSVPEVITISGRHH